MNLVFADTLYWIASIIPGDPWHEPSLQAARNLNKEVTIITTQEILTEVLSACAGRGSFLRGEAVRVVHSIMANINVRVQTQSEQSFLSGLEFYERRSDKGYSLVDCVSMNVMLKLGISDILTSDNHFTQEGFNILIRK